MNRFRYVTFLGIFLFSLQGCGYLLQPTVQQGMANLEKGEYVLDPRHTTVLFKVDHLGLSKFVGRFNRVDASLDYDPADPASARLTAVIHTASIDVNDPDFSATLAGRSWFDSERFPEARFVTREVALVDGHRAQFIGELTLLGVTAPVTLDIHFNGGADNILTGRYTLGFSAATRFKRSQFGMNQYIPAVGDDIDIEVHAEFLRR